MVQRKLGTFLFAEFAIKLTTLWQIKISKTKIAATNSNPASKDNSVRISRDKTASVARSRAPKRRDSSRRIASNSVRTNSVPTRSKANSSTPKSKSFTP